METLNRELMEEIQAEIRDLRYLETLENIFTYEGKFEGEKGHEIVMVFDGKLADESLCETPLIARTDAASGEQNKVVWRYLSEFGPGKPPLYPDWLLKLLLKKRPPA